MSNREPLNKERASIFKNPPSFDKQVQDLSLGQLNAVKIDDFYTAYCMGSHITIKSTAPGALDNEQFGVYYSSTKALTRFFDALYRARNPEVGVMLSDDETEQFVSELEDLEEEPVVRRMKKAKKKGDKGKTLMQA